MIFIKIFYVSLFIPDLDHFIDFKTINIKFIANTLTNGALNIFLFFKQILNKFNPFLIFPYIFKYFLTLTILSVLVFDVRKDILHDNFFDKE